MTGIERLRKLVGDYKSLSTKQDYIGINARREADLLADIADQIDREQDKVAKTDWETVRKVSADMADRVFMSATIDELLRDWSRKLNDATDGHVVSDEREQGEHVSRMRVLSVISDMERHCLGHEGMEDSPVARWARELRGALEGRSDEEVEGVATVRADAMEAWRWVREHGGLDAMVELSSRLMTVDALRAAIEETCTRIGVEHTGDLTQDAQAIWREIGALRSRLNESVSRAAYERHLARRQRQIDESHAALRRRNRSIAELERRAAGCASSMLKSDASAYELQRAVLDQCKAFGVDVSECDTAFDMLHNMNETLSKRLMPEGMEWPRFEDGEPVCIGSEILTTDGQVRCEHFALTITDDDGGVTTIDFGERVKRPAVLAADGEPLEAGQTVYNVGSSEERVVDHIEYEGGGTPNVYYADGGWDYPDLITHQRPVLDADGVPINVGDTVWDTETGCGRTVRAVNDNETVEFDGYENRGWFGKFLTHTKPEPPDSWERIEEDADALAEAELNGEGSYNAANKYCNRRGLDGGTVWVLMASDLVRRCRTLAERGK